MSASQKPLHLFVEALVAFTSDSLKVTNHCEIPQDGGNLIRWNFQAIGRWGRLARLARSERGPILPSVAILPQNGPHPETQFALCWNSASQVSRKC